MAKRLNNKQIKAILDLRESFKRDLRYCKNPDEGTMLILKAKIVAIGQVLDAIGYEEFPLDIEKVLTRNI